MKLIAPNGKRITHSIDTMTVLHRISHVYGGRGKNKDVFAYDVSGYEDLADTIKPVTDYHGEHLFLDEDRNEWPRNQLKVAP